MTSSADYWKRRAVELENTAHQDALTTSALVDDQYKHAMLQVDKDIHYWYQKFADENGLSLVDAKKVLDAGELKDFQMTLKDYIKHGEELGVDQSWIQQMKNASAKHHIERLDAIKMQTQQTCEVLYGGQLDAIDKMAREVYTNTYYHETFNLQQSVSTGWAVNNIDAKKLDTVIKKPWAPDGEDFSSRIWKNKSKLVNDLHTEITQSCINGKSIDQMAESIQKKMGVAESNARRLVATESAHFSSAGDLQAYTDAGVKQYQILATLDDRTSEICQDMDGQVFDISDFSEGMTAPPFHAYCRSTTVPYFDDFTENEMRAARGEDGKTYDVPADMAYGDWKVKYVDNSAKSSIINAKKELGIVGTLTLSPEPINLTNYKFDDKHIKSRKHGVSKDEAIGFANNSIFSLTRWNGTYVNYYSDEGAAYVNTKDKTIRTAFRADEYDDKISKFMEVLKKNGY